MNMIFQQFIYGEVKDFCLHYFVDCISYCNPQLNKALHNFVDYQSQFEKAKFIYHVAKGY